MGGDSYFNEFSKVFRADVDACFFFNFSYGRLKICLAKLHMASRR